MIKEHAALIVKKENERRVDITRITSYPEYYVLREELEKMIATLDRIDAIDFESSVSVEVQALANKLAKDKISKFLSDMNSYSNRTGSVIDRTYA